MLRLGCLYKKEWRKGLISGLVERDSLYQMSYNLKTIYCVLEGKIIKYKHDDKKQPSFGPFQCFLHNFLKAN